MRFLLGIGLGLGIGLAGAMLFAPEKKKRSEWPPRAPQPVAEVSGNHHTEAGLKGFVDSVKKRLDEALQEARQAQQQTEREMMEKYERSIGKK